MEGDLNFWQMEDDLNFIANGRQPQFRQMEDNLNSLIKGKRPYLLVNTGKATSTSSMAGYVSTC